MIKLTEIKKSITLLLKDIYDIDVFYTNVGKTDSNNDEEKLDKYYHVSLKPIGTNLHGKVMRDRAFFVDVAYINNTGNDNDMYEWSVYMDEQILPYIVIGDRSITIEESNFKIVDRVGHYCFSLKFRDIIDSENDGVIATDLDISFK